LHFLTGVSFHIFWDGDGELILRSSAEKAARAKMGVRYETECGKDLRLYRFMQIRRIIPPETLLGILSPALRE
jgi:hypothetical protein